MSRIAWAGLMRLGMAHMRLSPDVFWNLTPAELMLIAGVGPGQATMTRAGLAELLAQFPDAAPGDGDKRE